MELRVLAGSMEFCTRHVGTGSQQLGLLLCQHASVPSLYVPRYISTCSFLNLEAEAFGGLRQNTSFSLVRLMPETVHKRYPSIQSQSKSRTACFAPLVRCPCANPSRRPRRASRYVAALGIAICPFSHPTGKKKEKKRKWKQTNIAAPSPSYEARGIGLSPFRPSLPLPSPRATKLVARPSTQSRPRRWGSII